MLNYSHIAIFLEYDSIPTMRPFRKEDAMFFGVLGLTAITLVNGFRTDERVKQQLPTVGIINDIEEQARNRMRATFEGYAFHQDTDSDNGLSILNRSLRLTLKYDISATCVTPLTPDPRRFRTLLDFEYCRPIREVPNGEEILNTYDASLSEILQGEKINRDEYFLTRARVQQDMILNKIVNGIAGIGAGVLAISIYPYLKIRSRYRRKSSIETEQTSG